MRFFLMSQGSFKVPRSKGVLCSSGTDTKVITEDTLSWFQDFFQIFLKPIIKERSNFGIFYLFVS